MSEIRDVLALSSPAAGSRRSSSAAAHTLVRSPTACALGAEVLNDVVLNQVLFRFATDEETERVLAAAGGTVWAGRRAIRISVSNWQTTDAGVERTLAAYRAAVGGHVAAR